MKKLLRNKYFLLLSFILITSTICIILKKSYALVEDNVMIRFWNTPIQEYSDKITEVYFQSDSQENIDSSYNNASIKADLTYNSTGNIKAWLEPKGDNYVLYVKSKEKIILDSGHALFNTWSMVNKIVFENLDTSLVEDMSFMFSGCTSLTSLDLSSFDTSQVINMESMFSGCTNLKSIDLKNFNTSQVTSMESMFNNCYNLVSLNLNSFDTKNVTVMKRLFFNC